MFRIKHWKIHNICNSNRKRSYTSEFHEDFIENYNEESDEGHFLKDDVPSLENLHELRNDLPFLPERIKIEKLKACY